MLTLVRLDEKLDGTGADLGLVLEGRDGLGVLVVGSNVVVQRAGSSRVEAYTSGLDALVRASSLTVANDNCYGL